VVEEEAIMTRSDIKPGDVVLGIPSSGLHTNGFSLVRKVFDIDTNPAVLYQKFNDLGHGLGEELLIPHKCYYPMIAPCLSRTKGIAHISGGGISGNLARILPDGISASIDRSSWEPQPIFDLLQSVGGLSDEDMFTVFNMGIGIVLVCDRADVDDLVRSVPTANVIGELIGNDGEPQVVIH